MQFKVIPLSVLIQDVSLLRGVEIFWSEKTLDVSVGYTPVWQMPEWGSFLERVRQVSDEVFFGVYDAEKLLGYGLAEIRSVGLGKQGIYVVGGPNFLNKSFGGEKSAISKQDSTVQQIWSDGVIQYVREHTFLFVLCEPTSEFESSNFRSFQGEVKHLLEPVTRMLDLRKTEEELLSDMKQKGRYNIKMAQKNNCIVNRVEATQENIDIFYKILQDTTERDGFSGNSKAYYVELLSARTHPQESLYFAFFENRVIAAAILTITGNTAVYYYGASVSDVEARKVMAPYLLQWEMIRASKLAGCTWYDFLGTAPEGDEKHHLAGVTEFKSKFGGEIYNWPTKQIFVPKNFQFMLFIIARKLRSLVK